VQHFEILTLEGAQAGLNWLTVLRRRFGYRKVFARFDVEKVAAFSPEKCLEIRKDIRIIRNQLKIDSTVNNAKCFLEVQAEFGSFDKYIWGFVGGKPLVNQWENHSELPAQTELSGRIADDLKERGFRLVGPTIIYAYLQAAGLVNDHTIDCFRHKEVHLSPKKKPRAMCAEAYDQDDW
jgi:DNA-3-methyladenine glycosylase I